MKVKKSEIGDKLALALPTYRFEADGGSEVMRLYLSGIIGIGELSQTAIRMITKKQSITVTGKMLTVSVFEGNAVELIGKIENISLSSAGRTAVGEGDERRGGGGKNGKNR
ncbi:MAG: hypothetical protein IKD45_03275 [Clostridia bacterium]|nr:hypothetical protein [Clostridia bacterium]